MLAVFRDTLEAGHVLEADVIGFLDRLDAIVLEKLFDETADEDRFGAEELVCERQARNSPAAVEADSADLLPGLIDIDA